MGRGGGVYDPKSYWSAVGERVREREETSPLAGDDTPFQRYKREQFVERLLRTLDLEGRSVLEVGSGPGGNLIEMAALGAADVVGADIAPAMVQLARERTAQLPNVRCVALSGGPLPFEGDAFDVALTVTVLQHNGDDEVRHLLREMARVSRTAIHIIEDVAGRRIARGPSYVARRPRDYAGLLEPLGFGLVSTTRLNVFASEGAYVLLNSRLHGLSRQEGAPVHPALGWLERASLALTRRLDRRVPARVGLARMDFLRG